MSKTKRTYFVCPDCNHHWSVDSQVYSAARLDNFFQRRAIAISKCHFAFCKKCGSQGDVVKD